MNFKNPFKREKLKKRQTPVKPKKNKCKIRIRKTSDGEQFEFSPECTKEQIEFAKQNRLERGERDEY